MAVVFGADAVVYGADAVVYGEETTTGSYVVFGADSVVFGTSFVTFGTPTAVDEPTVPVGGFDEDGEFVPVVWTWAAGPGASSSAPGAVRELVAATGRRVTWRTATYAFAQFELDGRSDDAQGLVERETDLWIYRDGVHLFRGRIVRIADSIDENRHTCSVYAVDYRGLLGLAANVGATPPTYTAEAQGDVVWDLIDRWQATAGGDWGITDGEGAGGGDPIDETDITPGTPVAEVIDQLAERIDGFEWEIDETLAVNRWYPQRGADNGTILDYGGLVSQVTVSTPTFANAAVVTGSTSTTPTEAASADVATDPRGRWGMTASFPSVVQQSTLTAKANWIVQEGQNAAVEYTATLSAGRWGGRDHVWVGDTVELRVQSGRLQVSDLVRVAELSVACGDHGTETVTAGLVGAAT